MHHGNSRGAIHLWLAVPRCWLPPEQWREASSCVWVWACRRTVPQGGILLAACLLDIWCVHNPLPRFEVNSPSCVEGLHMGTQSGIKPKHTEQHTHKGARAHTHTHTKLAFVARSLPSVCRGHLAPQC